MILKFALLQLFELLSKVRELAGPVVAREGCSSGDIA
jgi:hypothetical protein